MSGWRTLRTIATSAVSFCITLTGVAGNFSVTPIRVNLDPKVPRASVTLRNLGTEAVVVQAELLKWKPFEEYVRSRELLVNPVIFTVPPQASQIVRIGISGLLESARPDQELAYRLFLQEVPPRPKKGKEGLRTALKIGIPVFVPPTQPHLEVRWNATLTRRGQLKIHAKNDGNVHVQIAELKLTSPSSGAGEGDDLVLQRDIRDYLLPGDSKHWLIHSKARWNADTVLLWARTDGEALNAKLRVEKP
jgi:fimbrial chaperone protein